MTSDMLGKPVTVRIERPLGLIHSDYADMPYPVNYGYIQGGFIYQNEPMEAYLLGVNKAVDVFEGVVAGMIYRENGKMICVVTPPEICLSKEDIYLQTLFIERFFNSKIVCE